MYVTVYSPEGEMFEVIAEKAATLKLQHGWTSSRPEVVEIEEAPAPRLFLETEEDPEADVPFEPEAEELEEKPKRTRKS